jgi:hypothetical protein
MGQGIRQSSKIDPCKYAVRPFTEEKRQPHGTRIFSTNCARTTGHPMPKNERWGDGEREQKKNLDTAFTKIDSD